MGKFKQFLKGLIRNWQGTVVLATLWLILGWLYSFGIRAVFFIPLNYLSGALAGLQDGSIIGGTVGKVLLMAFLNGFITTLILHKGSFREKWSTAAKHYKTAILDTIPYFKNLREFDYKNPRALWLNIAGIGFGFITYAFLTGNGSFINSFVCLLLFFELIREVVEKRGIISAFINLLLSGFGTRRISRKPMDYFVNGYAIGTLSGILYAFLYANQLVAYLIGAFFLILGLIMSFLLYKKRIGGVQTCEE